MAVSRKYLIPAEWALANTNPGDNPWIIRDVSIEWVKKYPVDVVDWLESQNDSRGQRESVGSDFAQWAGKDSFRAVCVSPWSDGPGAGVRAHSELRPSSLVPAGAGGGDVIH